MVNCVNICPFFSNHNTIVRGWCGTVVLERERERAQWWSYKVQFLGEPMGSCFIETVRLAVVYGMRVSIWNGNWTSICRMGHPIGQRAMDLITTKHNVSIICLNRLATIIESQQLLQVRLHYTQASVNGWVAKSVRQETEVGEAWVGVVGVIGFDVTGASYSIQHCLKL